MTLQELDTINRIAIDAEVDFEEMLNIIGIGAADLGILLCKAGKDDTKCKIICNTIDKTLYEGDDIFE